MRISKTLVYCNIAALVTNAVIIYLVTAKCFPAFFGICMVIAFFGGATWFSCYANGKLPKKERQLSFYSAPTEEVRRI